MKSVETIVEIPEALAISESQVIKTDLLEKLPLLQLFISSIELLPDFLFVNTDKKYTRKQLASSIYALGGMHGVSAQTDPADLLHCAKPQYGFNLEIGYQKTNP